MRQRLQASRDRRAAWCEVWRLWRALCRLPPAFILVGPQVDECAWWACWLGRQPARPWRWLRCRLLGALYRHADPQSPCPPPGRCLRGAVYRLRLRPPSDGHGWRLRVR
ncbi:MAG TPA: hypothetical protein VFP94_02005 [Terriglobales bacterium]|nr:hypothetical protein [Terriglobales bacterium]